MCSISGHISLSYSTLTSSSTVMKISLLTPTHWLLGPTAIFWKHMNISHMHSSECVSPAMGQAIDNISFNSHNARRQGTLSPFNDKVTEPQGHFVTFLESQN